MSGFSKYKMYLTVILFIWIPSLSAFQSLQNDCLIHLDRIVCKHNIPRDIPDGVKSVTVNQMTNGTSDIIIHSDLFIGRNWNTVERLALFVFNHTTIVSNAFLNLKKLLYLAIHENLYNIENDGLVGLLQAEILDLSDCRYLPLDNVTAALNGSDKMSKLQEIYLININLGQSLKLDNKLFSVLASKDITTIDFSKTTIDSVDFPALFDKLCQRPLTLRLSKCNFISMTNTNGNCSELQVLDISYAKLDGRDPSLYDNDVILVGSFIPMFAFFFHVKSFIADGLVHDNPIQIHNQSYYLEDEDLDAVQNISLADNQLEYIDVKFLNFPRRLQRLNLSSNGMSYLQPKFLFENNSLTNLDLSHNSLHKMANANLSDFGILLRVYRHLQYINMSYNQVTLIPTVLFVGNPQLCRIDLSHNQLVQVEFDLDHNNKLQYLNLAYNKMITLSELSLQILQELVMKNPMFRVDIRNNDIGCDTCSCKDFIEWILKSKDAVITDMNCRSSDGNIVTIDDNAVTALNDMCQREQRLLIGTMVPLASIIVLVVITLTVRKYLRRGKQIRTRKEVIKMIQEGDHQFRFVTFLAFSGEDELFVEENVRKPLENRIRDLIGTDRDLICTGDRHFQLGCTIGDQMQSCCHKCGSVILVISPAFCKSPHCNNEMNIAYANGKPIILMFKEHVEEIEMTPLLRVIFKQYTRVIWTARDGEYTLSTSWENICESLIDWMVNTKQ